MPIRIGHTIGRPGSHRSHAKFIAEAPAGWEVNTYSVGKAAEPLMVRRVQAPLSEWIRPMASELPRSEASYVGEFFR